DDVETGISHVIRGDDHLANTAVHLRLIEALGAPAPVFAHLPLVVGADGAPLSKRDGAVALEHLRDLGVEAPPLVAYLLGLGTGRTLDATEDPALSLDLAAFGRAAPVFDPSELARAQDRWLQALDTEAANRVLAARGLPPVTAPLWQAIRGNLGDKRAADVWQRLPRLTEVAAWREVVETPFRGTLDPDAGGLLHEAAAGLDDDVTSSEAARAWLDRVAEATGRRGRKLLLPLRLALTGRGDGPPIPDLIALIGAERARLRLRGERA
ncbi:MAG: glutamate--tRNA ligase family protein, partial [Pseudomonadota bacterium]